MLRVGGISLNCPLYTFLPQNTGVNPSFSNWCKAKKCKVFLGRPWLWQVSADVLVQEGNWPTVIFEVGLDRLQKKHQSRWCHCFIVIHGLKGWWFVLTSDLSPPELVSQRLGDNEICVRIGMVYGHHMVATFSTRAISYFVYRKRLDFWRERCKRCTNWSVPIWCQCGPVTWINLLRKMASNIVYFRLKEEGGLCFMGNLVVQDVWVNTESVISISDECLTTIWSPKSVIAHPKIMRRQTG